MEMERVENSCDTPSGDFLDLFDIFDSTDSHNTDARLAFYISLGIQHRDVQ